MMTEAEAAEVLAEIEAIKAEKAAGPISPERQWQLEVLCECYATEWIGG